MLSDWSSSTVKDCYGVVFTTAEGTIKTEESIGSSLRQMIFCTKHNPTRKWERLPLICFAWYLYFEFSWAPLVDVMWYWNYPYGPASGHSNKFLGLCVVYSRFCSVQILLPFFPRIWRGCFLGMRASELNVNLMQNARRTEVQKYAMHHCCSFCSTPAWSWCREFLIFVLSECCSKFVAPTKVLCCWRESRVHRLLVAEAYVPKDIQKSKRWVIVWRWSYSLKLQGR
jgi:hypothetical protein